MKPSSIRLWHLEQFIVLSLTSHCPWGLAKPIASRLRDHPSDQLQSLQARMPMFPDNNVASESAARVATAYSDGPRRSKPLHPRQIHLFVAHAGHPARILGLDNREPLSLSEVTGK
jgi:hypothetical protein